MKIRIVCVDLTVYSSLSSVLVIVVNKFQSISNPPVLLIA